MSKQRRLRVVIAGGGVAAIEALLALRELARERVDPVLLAPGPDFVHQPLAVAEPFGGAEPYRLSLATIASDAGAVNHPDSFAGIDVGRRLVHTIGGDALPFDALLIATGARRMSEVPGALTYRGGVDNPALSNLLREAARGKFGHLAFAVPGSVHWPLPIYELALLSASHLRNRGLDTRVSLITPESRPLGLFGRRASEAVRSLLARTGVELRALTTPLVFDRGELVTAAGRRIRADRVVALPKLEVPGLTGVPQGPRGFIGTDRQMRVEGRPRVFAAGDATWFPIKQGGIAAQQADAAASTIASIAGAEVNPQSFSPVLRAAILTGEHPLFLRTAIGGRDERSAASEEPLWWPPSKVAGKYLASYLRDLGQTDGGALEDLDQPWDDEPVHPGDHREAVDLALRAADLDAAERDFRGALRWLQVAEDLDLALPDPYGARRAQWRRTAERAEPQALHGGAGID